MDIQVPIDGAVCMRELREHLILRVPITSRRQALSWIYSQHWAIVEQHPMRVQSPNDKPGLKYDHNVIEFHLSRPAQLVEFELPPLNEPREVSRQPQSFKHEEKLLSRIVGEALRSIDDRVPLFHGNARDEIKTACREYLDQMRRNGKC